jgi:hypothetical protein
VIVLPILIGALAAADPAPAAAAPAAQAQDAPPAAAPAPSSAPSGTTPATPGPGPATSDDDDQAGATSPPAGPPAGSGQAFPTPYTDLDAKAYSDAVLAAAHAEQSMQGPLDGGWSVTDQAGKALYSLRMVDHGQGMSLAEGAWRDLAAPAGPAAVGFVESVGYEGSELLLRFYETGPDDLVVLTLTPSTADAWTGELSRHGKIVRVIFRRERS